MISLNISHAPALLVCNMTAVYSLLLAHSPWRGRIHRGRAAVQLWAFERSWNPLLRLCSFLSRSHSPSLCRPPPDNAVATCSIKQPQPGWRICGGMTVVKDLVDVCQRQRSPSGYVLYVEGVVSPCQHCHLTVRQMWLWYSCSPGVCLGFCLLSKDTQVRYIRDSKLCAGININDSLCVCDPRRIRDLPQVQIYAFSPVLGGSSVWPKSLNQWTVGAAVALAAFTHSHILYFFWMPVCFTGLIKRYIMYRGSRSDKTLIRTLRSPLWHL